MTNTPWSSIQETTAKATADRLIAQAKMAAEAPSVIERLLHAQPPATERNHAQEYAAMKARSWLARYKAAVRMARHPAAPSEADMPAWDEASGTNRYEDDPEALPPPRAAQPRTEPHDPLSGATRIC